MRKPFPDKTRSTSPQTDNSVPSRSVDADPGHFPPHSTRLRLHLSSMSAQQAPGAR